MPLTETIVYERGDKIYLVAPVRPHQPSDEELAGFDFIEALRKQAPNEHIAWFAGHYVEADRPNGNGAMWEAKDLNIASLTPMLMPITVMHDPRTAVGLIAHAALRTPDKDQVPRAKIDTALAVWRHRFPDVVEEAEHNYRQGMLMQSMECLAPRYDCSGCGMGYIKLADGAERANWCDHLRNGEAARTLRDVIFTGTGLIFGSRGARGADPSAHLEAFQEEVAEFHERVHRGTRHRSKPNMDTIEINRSEYDELKARPTADELASIKQRAEQAEKDLEAAEAAKVAAEQQLQAKDTELAALKEREAEQELRDKRLSDLGDGFKAALGEKTKERLTEQAGKLAEEEWAARLDELEELTKTKRDATASGTPPALVPDGSVFKPEELAAFQGGGSPPANAPSEKQRRTALAGL